MLPLGPWTAEVGISWVLASRFTSFNVIERCTVQVDGVVGFGAAFVAHHGSLSFGGTPLATDQKAITVDRFRNLRFICVYPVQLEGTLAKTSCLHCRLARCVLMVGMQHVLTVRVPMRWAVKGMYPAPHIHEHFTIHKWLRQTAYILTHNLNMLEHIANNGMNTTMHTDANIAQF